MQLPDRIHFFSYATGVSLELPVGFTGHPGQADSVVYVRHDDEGETVQAAIIVATIGSGPAGGETLLVDGMASVSSEVLARAAHDIDDEQVAVAELHFPHGLPSREAMTDDAEVAGLLRSDLLVTFAATAFAGSIVTITAVAPFDLADQYRPVFADAVESCRFISVDAA